MPNSFASHFEIDIVGALSSQLVYALESLQPAQLTPANVSELRAEQGVYFLFRDGALVYVGKANQLLSRLEDHFEKVRGRKNISIDQMTFAALYVHPNWTALAPEHSLIKHYKSKNAGLCEWNGIGFGPHDPGRNREITDKDPDGFDVRYPINSEYSCSWLTAGTYNVLELLIQLKERLPYLLRYEVAETASGKRGHYRSGHPAYNNAVVHVPRNHMAAEDVLKAIADSIGWQATMFPSHMILYNEDRAYAHGRKL